MSTIGFIVLRHVNSPLTNTYWIRCYKSIRQFYPEHHILIIDDNSKREFLTDEDLYKTTIINSEYHGRGELLPYYYYLHNKMFDTAIIIHDSVFIQQFINFTVDKYKILWHFEHTWDNPYNEHRIIKVFNSRGLLSFYSKNHLWKGCFGGMAIITHDYLTQINSKYNFSKLLSVILTRQNRCSFERVIACLLQINSSKESSLLGNIHAYCNNNMGITIHDVEHYKHLPLLKVFSGR